MRKTNFYFELENIFQIVTGNFGRSYDKKKLNEFFANSCK